MVRFKNRYISLGIAWKDGRSDESLSAYLNSMHCISCVDTHLGISCSIRTSCLPSPYSRSGNITDEGILLQVFRDELQRAFGDYGLGSALASFQGMCCTIL